ncbi:MAG: hypothetical protein HY301_20345 [Verrucomicrobia bacterium]|nr:hypothetical protein [Verrucomicrobiota bacterium]
METMPPSDHPEPTPPREGGAAGPEAEESGEGDEWDLMLMNSLEVVTNGALKFLPGMSGADYQKLFGNWLDQNPDRGSEAFRSMHKVIRDHGASLGFSEASDFPEGIRFVLSECAICLGAQLIKKSSTRVNHEVAKLRLPKRIAAMEEVVADLDQAEEYLLDAEPAERPGWLDIVRPLRAQCHRLLLKLRAQR